MVIKMGKYENGEFTAFEKSKLFALLESIDYTLGEIKELLKR